MDNVLYDAKWFPLGIIFVKVVFNMKNLISNFTSFVVENKHILLLAAGSILVVFGAGMQVGISAVLKAVTNVK